jgi:hypothetical protein
MKKAVKFLAVVAVAAIGLSAADAANAFPFSGFRGVTIRGDRGGQVIQYALQMKRMERSGSKVRFAGRCDSACTLYLALPRKQTCVMPGASFGFHLPYGASRDGNRIAASYMMRNYPGWVRSWIRANGGLGRGIKTMSYSYARQYLPTCAGTPVRSFQI